MCLVFTRHFANWMVLKCVVPSRDSSTVLAFTFLMCLLAFKVWSVCVRIYVLHFACVRVNMCAKCFLYELQCLCFALNGRRSSCMLSSFVKNGLFDNRKLMLLFTYTFLCLRYIELYYICCWRKVSVKFLHFAYLCRRAVKLFPFARLSRLSRQFSVDDLLYYRALYFTSRVDYNILILKQIKLLID